MFYNIGERKELELTKPIDDLVSVDEGWSKRTTKDGYIEKIDMINTLISNYEGMFPIQYG